MPNNETSSESNTKANETEAVGLAVVMCTFNNIRTIEPVLESIASIADRIVIVDSGSTDETLDIVAKYNTKVIHRPWPGPVDQKQFAIDTSPDARWVLLLDSDEIIEPTLQRALAKAVADDDPSVDGWTINRIVRMFGTDLLHTYQPERRLRLIRGGIGKVVGIGPEGKGGHDRIDIEGKVGNLEGNCIHDSWADLDAMMQQHMNFARRAALYNPKGGRAIDILTRPPIAMFKQYVLKQGFRDGKAGFFACATVFCGTLMKHIYIARQRWIERKKTER